MQPISFTNGSRIFTPSNQAAPPQPQVGDINQDGIVDILDVSDANSYQLTDLNNDGIVDILDANILISGEGPGGIPNPVPTPTNPPIFVEPVLDENFNITIPFVDPTYPYCADANVSEPRFTFANGQIQASNNGIITTGCNSVYTVDGEVIWPDDPPEDILFCPEGKARGWTFDAGRLLETDEYPEGQYPIYYSSECECAEPDTIVNGLDLATIFIGGPGKKAGKKAAKKALVEAAQQAENSLTILKRQITETRNLLDAAIAGKKNTEAKLKHLSETWKKLQQAKITGKHPDTGLPLPQGMIDKLDNAIAKVDSDYRKTTSDLLRDQNTIDDANKEIINILGGIDYWESISKQVKEALSKLDTLDPERWASIIFGALFPLGQILVKKTCPSTNQVVDPDTCECVPRSSGSYMSFITNNIQIPEGYNLVESL